MAGPAGYPKEMPHPCGFKTVMAYDADEERANHAEFQRFRMEHMAAQASALKGETIKAEVKK